MSDVYLDNEMEAWEQASDNDCERLMSGEPLHVWPRFSRQFSWAWFRHLELESHDAQYEVCDKLVCRIAWALENWLWYGGKAVP